MVTWTPRFLVSDSIRAASFAAAPITVNSRRSGMPILPYVTLPICNPIQNPMGLRLPALADPLSTLIRSYAWTAASTVAAAAALPSSPSIGKDRENGVAIKARELAAVIADRACYTVEKLIEVP